MPTHPSVYTSPDGVLLTPRHRKGLLALVAAMASTIAVFGAVGVHALLTGNAGGAIVAIPVLAVAGALFAGVGDLRAAVAEAFARDETATTEGAVVRTARIGSRRTIPAADIRSVRVARADRRTERRRLLRVELVLADGTVAPFLNSCYGINDPGDHSEMRRWAAAIADLTGAAHDTGDHDTAGVRHS